MTRCSSSLFPSCFSAKAVYKFLSSCASTLPATLLEMWQGVWRSSLYNFLHLPPTHSWVEIFSPESCSQTPSVYVLPIMWETTSIFNTNR
jgi:hypothetical protein